MRIAFDMDGTITEGRFLEPPRTFEAYMSLGPYDPDTAAIWNGLNLSHEIFIVTARSDYRADSMIRAWLARERMMYPTSIISGIPQPSKWFLSRLMNCDVMVDDSPNVAETAYNTDPILLMMDNPHWKKNQEHEPYPHIRRIASWKELGQTIEAINIKKSYESLTAV